MANTKITSNVISDDIALGGNPTTTTQSAGNNTTRIATTAFVKAAIDATIDSAPGALDTLNELAAAIGDDANFSTTITNSIATKVALSGSGQTLADSGDLTLDVAGDIILDADGGDILLKDGGTEVGRFLLDDNNHLKLKSIQSDADILFQGNDDGSGITALRLDMSNAGKATFNAGVVSANDTDTQSILGRTAIGFVTGFSDHAYVGHLDVADTGGYALVQSAAGATYLNAEDGQDLSFSIHGTRKMVLDSNGNLGIGTTSPTSPLHIASSTNRTLLLDYTGGSGGYTWASFKQSGTEQFRIFGDYTHDYLAFYNDQASLYQLVLNDDGKVGMGIQEPLDTLHVNNASGWSTLRLSGSSSTGGQIEFYASTNKKANMWADNSTGDLFIRAGGVNTTVKFNADGNWVGPHEDCNQRNLIGRGPFNVFDFADDWSQTYDPANNTEHSVLGNSNTNQMGVTMTYPSSAANCSKCVLTYKRTPTGSIGTVLLCEPSTTSTFNGGWGSGPFTVDPDKGYIFGYYAKRTSSASDGTHYAGFSHGVAAGTGSTVDSNPYFQAFGNSGLPQDVWTLHYYHLHPRYYTGTGDGGIGGVYRCDTGVRIYGQTAWKQPTNQTTQTFRTYNYYSANEDVSIQWYAPFVYEINGHEPTIGALLPNF